MLDLRRYIHKKITSGQDYDQISQILAKKGHSSEEIQAAFSKYNYCRNLSNYISRQASLGSSYEKIKLALVNQGYHSEDVLFAESLVTHHTVNLKLIVGGVAICIIALVTLLVVLLRPSSPSSLLDYELNPNFKILEQDETLIFNVKLINFGKSGRFDVELEHTIMDYSTEKVIDYASETVAVETQTSKTVEMDLDNIEPGRYRLSSIARYKGQTADASFTFTIIKDIETLPIDPDSVDPDPIYPDPIDPDPVSPTNFTRPDKPIDDPLGRIIKGIETSTTMAQKEAVCEAQDDNLFSDYCWDKLATDSDIPTYCAYIAHTENMDFCILTVALNTQDHELCMNIDTPSYRATCQTI